MTLLFAAMAPIVASFYSEPALMAITPAIALKFSLDSLSIVPIALMNRKIQFRKLAKIQIATTVIAGLSFGGGAVRCRTLESRGAVPRSLAYGSAAFMALRQLEASLLV